MPNDSGSDSDQWADAYTASAHKSAPTDIRLKGKLSVAKTVPPHLLTGRSFLEQQCHWFDHPRHLFDTFKEDDPLQRMYHVLRWYFSALSGMHQNQGDKLRKPYNPVLGEQLHVKIDAEDQRIEMLCEQVSHHPPVTAFHFENQVPGFSFYGTIGDRSKFRGTSMRVKTSGSATLQLRGGLNESYHITYPSLDVTGLLTSKTKGTLAGTCGIQCDETRLMARIKFADKGAVKIRVGSFTPEAAAAAADPAARWSLDVDKELAVITGTWNKGLALGPKPAAGSQEGFWEAPAVGTETRKHFKGAASLGECDTWRVWELVTLHLAMGMYEQAGQYKEQLEARERSKARQREATGQPWAPRWFDAQTHRLRDPHEMARMCGEPVWDNATVEISLPTVTRDPLNLNLDDE